MLARYLVVISMLAIKCLLKITNYLFLSHISSKFHDLFIRINAIITRNFWIFIFLSLSWNVNRDCVNCVEFVICGWMPMFAIQLYKTVIYFAFRLVLNHCKIRYRTVNIAFNSFRFNSIRFNNPDLDFLNETPINVFLSHFSSVTSLL